MYLSFFLLYTFSMKIGIYKHFKGGEYEVIGCAKDSETQEDFVVYKHLGEDDLWIRSKKMFLEEVDKPEINYKGPRFVYIRDN